MRSLAPLLLAATTLVPVLVGLTATSVQAMPPAVARQTPLPVATTQSAAVHAALRQVSAGFPALVGDWVRIARVSALPGQEAERAALVAELFRAAGLATTIRADGNVEAVLPGRRRGPPAVIAAHLDVLHAVGPDNPVRREGEVLTGPGVLDDTAGLAAILGAARALNHAGYRPERDLRFLATVGEEVGLLGARSYLADEPDLAAFIAVDGILGAVDHGATGIAWLRFGFHGRGGHTLLAPRTPSPAFAAGRAISSVAELAQRTDDPVNIGSVQGGDAPNAIPTEVSFTVDVRSTDALALERLRRDILRVCRAAADREGVLLTLDVLQDLPAARSAPGSDSPLVAGALDVLRWLDLPATAHPRGSADHVVALHAGIPAVAVGATLGRGAHSPRESADIALLEQGTQQVVLLAVLVGESLAPPEPPAPVAQ